MPGPYVCPVCGVEDYTPRARLERTCRYCAERAEREADQDDDDASVSPPTEG